MFIFHHSENENEIEDTNSHQQIVFNENYPSIIFLSFFFFYPKLYSKLK